MLELADIWESEQDLSDYFDSILKPVTEKINSPLPKEDFFQFIMCSSNKKIATISKIILLDLPIRSHSIFYGIITLGPIMRDGQNIYFISIPTL